MWMTTHLDFPAPRSGPSPQGGGRRVSSSEPRAGEGGKCGGRARGCKGAREHLVCIPECLQLREGRQEALQQQGAGVAEVHLGQAEKAQAYSGGFQVGCSSGNIHHIEMGRPRGGKEPPKSSQWGHLSHPGALLNWPSMILSCLGKQEGHGKQCCPRLCSSPSQTGQPLPCGLDWVRG